MMVRFTGVVRSLVLRRMRSMHRRVPPGFWFVLHEMFAAPVEVRLMIVLFFAVLWRRLDLTQMLILAPVIVEMVPAMLIMCKMPVVACRLRQSVGAMFVMVKEMLVVESMVEMVPPVIEGVVISPGIAVPQPLADHHVGQGRIDIGVVQHVGDEARRRQCVHRSCRRSY